MTLKVSTKTVHAYSFPSKQCFLRSDAKKRQKSAKRRLGGEQGSREQPITTPYLSQTQVPKAEIYKVNY